MRQLMDFRGRLFRGCLWLTLVAAATLLPGGCGKHETPVERGNRLQVLERGSHAEVTDLDPQTAVTITEIDLASTLFEGLVAEHPVDLHPVPGVAERWEVSPDNLSYTFQLRANARWSNGTPLTAADFVQSWRRILTPSLAAPNAGLLYVIQGAEAYHKGVVPDFAQVGVSAPSPHVLRVRLEHPTPYFLSLLSHPAFFPVPLSVVRQHGGEADRANRWTRPGTLVGNGPFQLETWRINDQIVVRKSDTYWDAATVRLNAIRFRPFESIDAEERAFRAGQLHLTYVLPFGRAAAYRGEQARFVRADPYLNTYFLRLNTAKPPLGDPRIRQALSLSIDRAALVAKVLRGGQQPATSLTPPGLPGYEPPALVRTDVAAARELLAEAGFPGGRGLPRLSLLFNTSENLRLIAEALQEMWRRELGIEVELINQERKVVLAERSLGNYQILIADWVADYLDPVTFLEPWRSDSGNNHTGWRNSEFDALLFASARNGNPESRAAELQKAEALLLRELPVVPLYYNPHLFLIQPSVQGWHPTLLDRHPYKHVWLEP